MIRIGDFSRLSRASIKTLRYYDETGLLKPARVDAATGYRYYDIAQLAALYRILALRDLGFSLQEIGRLLAGQLSIEQMRGMVILRRSELRQQVLEQSQRLERIERLLRQIEQENDMTTYDVILKNEPAMRVASIRDVVPQPPDQGALWGELMQTLNQSGARMNGTPLAVYHDQEFKERDWDIEVCMPVENAQPSGRVHVHDLPGHDTMACVVHAGPFATIGEAYDALARWIDANGYRIVGPGRELNLQMPAAPGDQNDPNTVNEIQFPVERAS